MAETKALGSDTVSAIYHSGATIQACANHSGTTMFVEGDGHLATLDRRIDRTSGEMSGESEMPFSVPMSITIDVMQSHTIRTSQYSGPHMSHISHKNPIRFPMRSSMPLSSVIRGHSRRWNCPSTQKSSVIPRSSRPLAHCGDPSTNA